MESFKPQSAPFWKTFLKNPVLHVTLFVAVVVSGGVYVYKNKQTETTNIASTSRPTVRVNSSSNLPPPPPAAPEPSSEMATASGGVTEPSPSPVVANVASSDADDSKELAAAKAFADAHSEKVAEEPKKESRTVAAKSTGGPHLIVTYAEVIRPMLGRMIESSRGTGQFMNFADYSAGIIPGLDKRIQAAGVKVLHKEERTLSSSKTMQWSYSIKDRNNPSVEIGLTTFFEIADVDGPSLRGNIEIQRTWREGSPTGGFEVQRKSFPAIFEIGNGMGFLMSGVMPAQSNLENDDDLTAIDVYKILRSPQFRAGESEFVIFVEYDNK
ncbi:hypothetical protein B9G69_005230 [Bdellovibrio sp. SKB1291214]|uniref:hypothetical protein n=1 Tax=Bdellovibrio sp. SKB1291214 TaxID=1732569 RepID=UPI002240116F|nr:hypothetical protein [Bdellovibrio sp. SKB1291214]UYL09977.1 hypothetical protein B9G69_005230 [Bdellovibrio sp. SKB1291214]